MKTNYEDSSSDQNIRKTVFFSIKFLRDLFVVLAGIGFFMLCTNYNAVKEWISYFLSILSPFILGIVIAYLLNFPVNFFENKVFYKIKKRKHALSILAVYILVFLLMLVMFFMVVPQLTKSLVMVFERLDDYLIELNEFMQYLTSHLYISKEEASKLVITWKDLVSLITKTMQEQIPQILSIAGSLTNGLVTFFMAVVASIYLLSDKEKLLKQIRYIIYAFMAEKNAKKLFDIADRSHMIFSRHVIGTLTDSAVVGCICFIFMSIFGFPYPLLISLILGMTNIIPFFGPLIGSISCLFIILMSNPMQALVFGIFILILQQLDGNILMPHIIGNSTGLSAIWVLAAIIVGGGLFGFVGMLIGVPVFAVIYNLIREYVKFRLAKKNIIDIEESI